MDWTQIITTLLTLLIPTGGLVAIFTMAEKKSAMMLDNAKASKQPPRSLRRAEEESRLLPEQHRQSR